MNKIEVIEKIPVFYQKEGSMMKVRIQGIGEKKGIIGELPEESIIKTLAHDLIREVISK